MGDDQTTGQLDKPQPDNRPAVYVEDGVAIYRASAVGLCEEALVALRMGVQPTMPPEWMQEKYDEGTAWEDHIVSSACEEHGLTLRSVQDEARYQITEQIVIRGSTDGSAQSAGGSIGRGWFGIEAKKLGPRLFQNWDRGMEAFWKGSPYYRDQLTVYMEALKMPFVYAVGEWDPEQKKVVRVHTRVIEEPPGDIQEIRMRVLRVEARGRAGDLGTCDGSHSFPCPVWFLHEGKERSSAGEHGAEIERLGRAYKEAQAMESRGKKIKGEVGAELKQLLAENGFVDLETFEVNEPEEVNGVKVTPYFSSYPRLDKAAMVEDGIDVARYETVSKSLAVRVSVKE